MRSSLTRFAKKQWEGTIRPYRVALFFIKNIIGSRVTQQDKDRLVIGALCPLCSLVIGVFDNNIGEAKSYPV